MKGFEALYRAHVQAVYRYAMSVTGRKAMAEDLTSEAFLALYHRLGSVDESRLPGWLMTVVRNRAHDVWKHEAVERRYVEEQGRLPASATLELERWMFESTDLKPIHRTCLILRYAHGLSRGEIAATTGLSETQVKGHLQYGLGLLRKLYKKGRPTDEGAA